MKLVKVLLIVIAVIVVIGGLFWEFFIKNQIPYAHIATAYGAKQVCSCRFVAERDMASCLNDFTLDLSSLNFKVTSSSAIEDGTVAVDDTVVASVLGGMVRSSARYEPGLGCALVKP